jgi:hypothetical protein
MKILSTSAGDTPARSTAPFTAVAPSSVAGGARQRAWNEPMGVRA